MESKSKTLEKKIESKVLKPLIIIQLLFVLMIFSSPFIWIWHSSELALKIGLTGLVGAIILYFICSIVGETIKKVVSESIEKQESYPTERKSKFQTKMDEMIKAKEDDKARNN